MTKNHIDNVGRFWALVEKTETCWLWKASCFSGKRYGQFKTRRPVHKNWRAHRFAYFITKGPIPSGLTLDHLCRNPQCVNPDHLEPVSVHENLARIPRAEKCSRGHLRVLGTRRCSICSSYFRPGRQSEHRKMLYRRQKERLNGGQPSG